MEIAAPTQGRTGQVEAWGGEEGGYACAIGTHTLAESRLFGDMYTHTYLSCTLLLPQKCRRLLRLAESLCTGPNWGYLSSQFGKGRAVSTLFTKLPHSPAWGQLRAGTQGLWTMVTILPPPSLTLSVPPPPDQHRAVLQSIPPPLTPTQPACIC